MYPQTFDLLLRQVSAAVTLARSAASGSVLQAADTLMRHSLGGSLRHLHLPAVALVAAALLLPFMTAGALRSLAHPAPSGSWGVGIAVAPPVDTPFAMNDTAAPAAEAWAVRDRSFEIGWCPFEAPAPRASSLRLTRRSIERGPPFFL